jgi:hypothetical protein
MTNVNGGIHRILAVVLIPAFLFTPEFALSAIARPVSSVAQNEAAAVVHQAIVPQLVAVWTDLLRSRPRAVVLKRLKRQIETPIDFGFAAMAKRVGELWRAIFGRQTSTRTPPQEASTKLVEVNSAPRKFAHDIDPAAMRAARLRAQKDHPELTFALDSIFTPAHERSPNELYAFFEVLYAASLLPDHPETKLAPGVIVYRYQHGYGFVEGPEPGRPGSVRVRFASRSKSFPANTTFDRVFIDWRPGAHLPKPYVFSQTYLDAPARIRELFRLQGIDALDRLRDFEAVLVHQVANYEPLPMRMAYAEQIVDLFCLWMEIKDASKPFLRLLDPLCERLEGISQELQRQSGGPDIAASGDLLREKIQHVLKSYGRAVRQAPENPVTQPRSNAQPPSSAFAFVFALGADDTPFSLPLFCLFLAATIAWIAFHITPGAPMFAFGTPRKAQKADFPQTPSPPATSRIRILRAAVLPVFLAAGFFLLRTLGIFDAGGWLLEKARDPGTGWIVQFVAAFTLHLYGQWSSVYGENGLLSETSARRSLKRLSGTSSFVVVAGAFLLYAATPLIPVALFQTALATLVMLVLNRRQLSNVAMSAGTLWVVQDFVWSSGLAPSLRLVAYFGLAAGAILVRGLLRGETRARPTSAGVAAVGLLVNGVGFFFWMSPAHALVGVLLTAVAALYLRDKGRPSFPQMSGGYRSHDTEMPRPRTLLRAA